MSLVDQAWVAAVPAVVIGNRWHLLELDSGRVHVKDTVREEQYTVRSLGDAKAMIAANAEAARLREARAAATRAPERALS